MPPKSVHNTSEGMRHGGLLYIPEVEFEHLLYITAGINFAHANVNLKHMSNCR